MGKVVEKVIITNFLDVSKRIQMSAVVDTGATMLVLPQNVIDQLGLRKIRDVKTRYANNAIVDKSIYAAVTLELKGRTGTFDVLAEEANTQALIGQVVLEILDFVVDTKARSLLPNPASPEIPLLEIL